MGRNKHNLGKACFDGEFFSTLLLLGRGVIIITKFMMIRQLFHVEIFQLKEENKFGENPSINIKIEL